MVAGMDQVRPQLVRTARRAVAGVLPATALVVLSACGTGSPGSADTPRHYPPGYIVDSIHPPEEALRRFRIGLDSVGTLNGPATRRELLERFQRAVERVDTAALMRLAIDRREFAWLVYPESRLARPPFRQPPEIAWMMLQQASESGLRKLLARAATMRLHGAQCPDSVQVEGRMRTTSGCTVRVQTPDTVRDVRLFGRIVELGGRWKIVGFDGDL